MSSGRTIDPVETVPARGTDSAPAVVLTPPRTPGLVREEQSRPDAVAPRRDRVRWGPVWAGLLVTLSTFILLELAFFALGWLTLGQGEPGTTAGWVSAAVGLFAFLLGGITAGATAMWRGVSDGLLHGILMWALATVGIIFLTLFGGGALLGSVADALSQVASLQQVANLPDVQAAQALGSARSGAAWAVLGLGTTLAAAAAGGAMAAKAWPRRNDEHPTDVR